jgi:hypothetical protein
MRQFRSASGRTWTVQIARSDNPAFHGDVLRFWSQGLTCELTDWPADWQRISEPALLQLLDRALTEWVATPRSVSRILGADAQSSQRARPDEQHA